MAIIRAVHRELNEWEQQQVLLAAGHNEHPAAPLPPFPQELNMQQPTMADLPLDVVPVNINLGAVVGGVAPVQAPPIHVDLEASNPVLGELNNHDDIPPFVAGLDVLAHFAEQHHLLPPEAFENAGPGALTEFFGRCDQMAAQSQVDAEKGFTDFVRLQDDVRKEYEATTRRCQIHAFTLDTQDRRLNGGSDITNYRYWADGQGPPLSNLFPVNQVDHDALSLSVPLEWAEINCLCPHGSAGREHLDWWA